jgi:hypothetical protein
MAEQEFVDKTKNPIFPPRTPGVPRWSPTGAEEYLSCGYYFYQKRILGKRFVRAIAATGKGIHAGAEKDSKKKLDDRNGLPVKEIVDIAVAAYDEEFKEGEVVDSKDNISEGRDKTATGATAFKTLISPEIVKPVAVELPVLARYKTEQGDLEVAGILDLSTEETAGEVVQDLKTGKRKKSADYAHGRGQLSAQGILLKAVRGKYPAGYSILDLYYGKRAGWQFQALTTDRTEEDYQSWWDRLLAVDAAVRAGSFPPAPEGSWRCSPAFCEFFATCKYVASRRRHLKEIGEDD